MSEKSIGFWINEEDEFDLDLPHPEQFVDPEWDPAVRAAAIEYLLDGDTYMECQGYSWCRFQCGIDDGEMGSRTLTDGEYIWPEGYAHYLEQHDVKPPEDFLEHMRRRVADS